jgi:hypothetical protein
MKASGINPFPSTLRLVTQCECTKKAPRRLSGALLSQLKEDRFGFASWLARLLRSVRVEHQPR